MNELVSTDWLHDQWKNNRDNLVIVDVRFDLGNPEAGRNAYMKGHLPEAVFVDLDKDLSSPVKEHGGRHPLPPSDQLAETLGKLGIDNDTKIVVYDDQGGVFASRFWWLLHHLGHSKIALLNGGYSKWVKDGYPTTTEISNKPSKSFTVQIDQNWKVASAHEVKEKLDDPETILIDAREPKRYLGITEPVDPIAGHIPSAVNHFWKNVLDDNGLWKEKEELEKVFANIPATKEIIVYCGSGVSACPNILALKKIGYPNVKLYAGSWSDWITYKDFPIAKEEK